MTTTEIGNIMKLNRGTIVRYLKEGTKLGWCYYNFKEEMKKIGSQNGGYNKKLVIMFKNNIPLRIFESIMDIETQSKRLFGINLLIQGIRRACLGKQNQYKGYTFKYIENLTPEEYIKYDIENKLKELHNQELAQAI
jgi:hypothetical protein